MERLIKNKSNSFAMLQKDLGTRLKDGSNSLRNVALVVSLDNTRMFRCLSKLRVIKFITMEISFNILCF